MGRHTKGRHISHRLRGRLITNHHLLIMAPLLLLIMNHLLLIMALLRRALMTHTRLIITTDYCNGMASYHASKLGIINRKREFLKFFKHFTILWCVQFLCPTSSASFASVPIHLAKLSFHNT
ncbi:hypothetical protein CMV_011472 [Castanea mollissima]|uniref:Uncharacterized protein n=1 Tax=Castanea mollissima TaxID=60419 RepID=A0A8J4RAX8_9ROSI|nr:hypothetical protein CMV_011472 [Castanea mollissima]